MAEFRGKVVIAQWKAQVAAGEFRPVVQALLTEHYDPSYLKSMQRNFSAYGQRHCAGGSQPHARGHASRGAGCARAG